MNTNPRRNAEGYSDPTAYYAMRNIQRGENRNSRSYKPLVYICSPFAGDVKKNTENARRFCRFAVKQNAIPFAPHLLYPQFMDDNDYDERELGMFFAMIWLGKCDELWLFGEQLSEGMKREFKKARLKGIPVKFFNSNCEVRTG